jgi:excisionase family DNA binding protein
MIPNPFEDIMVAIARVERKLSDLENRMPRDGAKGRFLNVKEAAQLLNMSPSSLYRMTMKDQVPVNRVNGRLFFSKEELMQFVQSNGTSPCKTAKPTK